MKIHFDMHKSTMGALALTLAVALASCGESGEAAADSIAAGEAAQANVEAAIMEGRTAARSFLAADPADTMAMQGKLLEARSIQSKYVTAGRKEVAEAFDTAFIHTLRAVRPGLAERIEAVYGK